MEEKKTVKRMVTKPVEEKFVPPVAEVVPEVVPETAPVVTPVVIPPELESNPSTSSGRDFFVESRPTQIKWGMFFAGVAATLVVVGVSGGLWWQYRGGAGLTSSPTPTPIPVVQTTPTPEPVVSVLDRGLITVDVLNGSGVVGKAGTVATKIVDLGYVKGATGNAKGQTGTTLELSSDIASMSATMLADIQEVVPGTTLTPTPLGGTSKARLVLGTE